MAKTKQEIEQWMRDKGVDEGVIKDEAGYIAEKYTDPDEDTDKVLESNLDAYIRRSKSGGDRDAGGYNTNYSDDSAERQQQIAAARPTSPAPAPAPASNGSMQSWLGQGQQAPSAPDYSAQITQQNELLKQMFERQVAEQNRIAAEQAAVAAERKQRADALYGQLQGRAGQALQVSPDDPIIKNQVDAYRAEQERALRNVRSDAAEGKQTLRPTQDRMASERVAQSVGSLQAELMARELGARRAEISEALSSMGGLLSADQQAGLQRELASLDNIIRQQQLGISGQELDLRRELGLGQLGLDTELGRGQLELDRLRNELLNRQFYADLGLRERGLQTDLDKFLAQMGFDKFERDRYYDMVSKGRLGNQI